MLKDQIQPAGDILGLLANVQAFLATRVERQDGGWPEITQDDRTAAAGLIHELIQLKWGRNARCGPAMASKLWPNGQFRMIGHLERKEAPEEESPEVAEARLMSNLRNISTTMAQCAEAVRLISADLDLCREDRQKTPEPAP